MAALLRCSLENKYIRRLGLDFFDVELAAAGVHPVGMISSHASV